MKRTLNFIKSEIVLVVSFVLAVGSMFAVPVSKDYLAYIDFRTLALLLCLMLVMAGFRSLGVFDLIAQKLLRLAKNGRSLYLVLVGLCFFSSMLITNDVALITFVPLTIITLNLAKMQKQLPYFVVMQTIAANLGSMLMPTGNPQNLYLFSAFDMSMSDFFVSILPYSVLSLVLLVAGSLLCKNKATVLYESQKPTDIPKPKTVLYLALFVLALLTVFRVIPYYILLAIVVAILLVLDRRIFLKADYSLLLTFVFLFVFIGNLGKIDAISSFLKSITVGSEVPVAVLASQVFSNVPACLLLSGFTSNAKALLVGVNLGGLGTLIASMASLISFKLIAKQNVKTGKYIAMFTVANVIFLVCLLILWFFIKN